MVLVGVLPTLFVLRQYSPDFGFTRLLVCGSSFVARSVPELKVLNPPCENEFGYDGQLYAQLATDPFLRGPDIYGALDGPVYRSRRILLPLLSWTLALGRPAVALQIYSTINLAFFWLLLVGMVRLLRPATAFQFACIAAAVLGTGSLISVSRAVTDLPAATFVFFSASFAGAMSTTSLAAAILTRETSVLALGGLLTPGEWRWSRRSWLTAVKVAAALLPFALWMFYVRYQLGSGASADVANFSWPFVQLARTIGHNLSAVTPASFSLHWSRVTVSEFRLVECLAPISLIVQALYLGLHRQPASAYWRSGIAFVPLFVCLGAAVLVDEMNYLRALLPMTIAFEVELMRNLRRTRWAWFLAGNLGLGWGFHEMLAKTVHAP